MNNARPGPLPEYREREGFTLVELLAVVGIVSLLIGLLLPAMGRARAQSKSVACQSNLRQMMLATQMYQQNNAGRFPLATYFVYRPPVRVEYNWDYIRTRDTSTGQTRIEPGTLWWGNATSRVQQCPTFDGRSVGYTDDPHTGYNYNTSYVGREMTVSGQIPVPPARASQVRRPSQTAVFGDGQYSAGANKFMRSPFPTAGESLTTGRWGGTQGFRHRGRTNVAFADGHVESQAERFTNTLPFEMTKVGPGTGFLSPDNSMYDLE